MYTVKNSINTLKKKNSFNNLYKWDEINKKEFFDSISNATKMNFEWGSKKRKNKMETHKNTYLE